MGRDVIIELKELRLHGMFSACTDLMAQWESAVASSKWLIELLLQAENTDRGLPPDWNLPSSPMHRDLAGFVFVSTGRASKTSY